MAGATVTVSWRDDREQRLHATTDSSGKAHICAPPQKPLNIRVAYQNMKSDVTTALTLDRATSHTSSMDLPFAAVRGTVQDQATSMPVTDVAVRIVNTDIVALTDREGRFIFEHVPVGDYSMRVEHIAYATNFATLKVRDQDLDAAIRLTPSAIPLQPIIVTAFSVHLERVGFYDRQKRGQGTFIGRKQIEAMNAVYASDLLRSIPSMRLAPQMPRRNTPRNNMAGRGNCRYRFMVDGSRTLADFEMDNLAVDYIEAIEIYNGSSEIPAAFRAAFVDTGAGACGLIAVWTKDGH